MAKISLLNKVLAATRLMLEFDGIAIQRTVGGEVVAVLHLSKPIEEVRGSQEVEFNGARVGLRAKDVVEVKIHQDDFEGVEWDDVSDTGSYEGSDLILDVSKQGQVWLRSQSFAAAGSEMRRTNQNNRLVKLLEGMGVKPADVKNPITGKGAETANTAGPTVVNAPAVG